MLRLPSASSGILDPGSVALDTTRDLCKTRVRHMQQAYECEMYDS